MAWLAKPIQFLGLTLVIVSMVYERIVDGK
jgi:hypothetical protein